MNPQAIQTQITQVQAIHDEVSTLTQFNRRDYRLVDYHARARQRISYFDHGEGDAFYMPQQDALQRLQNMADQGDAKFETAFKTSRTKLLSILARYIKSMQREANRLG